MRVGGIIAGHIGRVVAHIMIRSVHALSHRELCGADIAVCLGKQIHIAVVIPSDRASADLQAGFRELEIANTRSVRGGIRAVSICPRIGHGDGTVVRDRDPFKHQILPGFGLILVPGKAAVIMEGDGAGSVVIYGLLALDLARLVIDKVCFAGAGIADGQRIGVQLADNDPASQLPGAAAPFNGNKRLVIAEALYQGMRPVALILPDARYSALSSSRSVICGSVEKSSPFFVHFTKRLPASGSAVKVWTAGSARPI